MYGAFVWARRALNRQKRRFSARAVIELERLAGPTLCHLYTNCCITPNTLRALLTALHGLHQAPCAKEDFDIDLVSNYTPKITERCANYQAIYDEHCPGWEAVRAEIVAGLQAYEASGLATEGVIHGDPVFSNVIATPDSGLRLVDMRGKLGDMLTIRGDCMYDFAKTYQSVCGYDFVLLDRPVVDGYVEEMRLVYERTVVGLLGPEAVRHMRVVAASLYFSLIPLHDEPLKLAAYFALCQKVLDYNRRGGV